MAVSEHASGTQSAAVSTEHDLVATDTTDGVFQFCVDLAAMAGGDVVELRVKEKCLSAGTQRTVWTAVYSNDVTNDLSVSPPLILMHGWAFTLKQTAGTGRSFPWSARKT